MVYETVIERNGPSGRSPVIQPANTLRSPTPPPPLSSHLPLGSVLHDVHEELTPNDRSFEVAGAFYTQKGNARDEQGWRRAPWLPRGSDGWAAALPHEPFPREGGVVDAEEEERQSSKTKNSSGGAAGGGGPKRRTGAAGDGNHCMYSWWPSCSGVRHPQRQKQKPSQKPAAATPRSEAAAPSPYPSGDGLRSAADGSPAQSDSTADTSSTKPHDEGPKSVPSWWSYLSSFVV